jgi:hypothetical protein
MIPKHIQKANNKPTGIEIDSKVRNFKDIGVAFCTEIIAIASTQKAIATDVSKGAIVVIGVSRISVSISAAKPSGVRRKGAKAQRWFLSLRLGAT